MDHQCRAYRPTLVIVGFRPRRHRGCPTKLSRQLFDDEQVRVATRLHAVKLLRPFFWVAVALGIAWVASGYLSHGGNNGGYITIASGILVGLACLRFLWATFVWRGTQFAVTSHRLLGTTGGLRVRSWSIPLRNVARAESRRPLLGRLLGYGDVDVYASGKVYRLLFVARPRSLERALQPPSSSEQGARVDRAAESGTRSYTVPPAVGAGDDDQPPFSTAQTPRDASSRLAGRYVLGERIASGGMGTVHQGLDERLDRPVAIKILRDHLAEDPSFVERFRREARAAAMLSHSNVATIYDYIEEPDRHFIVMELLAGPDLARVLNDRRRIEVAQAVDICIQVLRALQHAHERGVIHRDVKPANVVFGDRERVKVTDFGIAQALGSARLTATNAFLGSAQYIAPERIRGERAGPRSDIYSLGVVLYEMVVGTVPFHADSLHHILETHLTTDVPAPSSARPGVPDLLDEVVLRATARAEEDRFGSAHEMMQALRALGEVGRGEAAVWVLEDTPPLPQMY